LGGFAIGARVALLWQHNTNPSYTLASIPRYDDIVRTAVWAGSARAAGRWLAGDGGILKMHAVYGKWPWPACRWLAVDGGRGEGAFSTLLRQSGLQAFTGGILAT